jgi:hypothetical protein
VAAAADAALLTETHRLAQARIGAVTVEQLLAAWPLLDLADLDATTARWLQVVVPLVEARHGESARLAAGYYATIRALTLRVTGFATPTSGTFDRTQALTSLTIMGPARVKSAMSRGVQLARAGELGAAGTGRAAMRLALNGGRDTILAATKSDRAATGWARVTSGAPCAFCASLVGMTGGESSVSFQAHDGCACSAEPVFAR